MQSPGRFDLCITPLAPGLIGAGGGAMDNSAPSPIRPAPTYKSGKAVQTIGATSNRYFTHYSWDIFY